MEFDTTKIKQNGLSEDGKTQYFVAVERKVMVQSITFQDTLIDIIGAGGFMKPCKSRPTKPHADYWQNYAY